MANPNVAESNDRGFWALQLWKRFLLWLLISCGFLTSMARADEAPSFFDEFAESLGQYIQRTAPATFPALISANNLALRVATPLANEETKPLVEILLGSCRYRDINHGMIFNEAITAIEGSLEEQFPDAIIRPRHTSIHIIVNLGARADAGTNRREREIVSGSISAQDFYKPSQFLGPLESLAIDSHDEQAVESFFKNTDAFRQLLEHRDLSPQENPVIEFSEYESLDSRNEATAFTIICDMMEDPEFLNELMAASSIDEANGKVLEWIATHPVIVHAIATYEVIEKDTVEIKTFRRHFEFNGKSWSMLPSSER